MILALARKEILENIRNYRLTVFLLLSCILIPFSVYVHYQNYLIHLDNYQKQQRIIQEERGRDKYYDLSHLVAYRKPTFMSVFADGISGQLPASYTIGEEGYYPSDYPSTQSTLIELVGGLDYLFVLQTVIALITLIFSADIIAAEKENGTLRLLFMNSVSRNTVLLGKAIGGYVSLTVPLSIAFFLGIIVLGNLDPDVFQAQYLAPILLIYLLSILFVAVYFGIGVAVSSSTTHVRSAIIISVSIWIFLQVVLPKIGSMIARTVIPVPSEVIKSVEKEQVRNAVAKEEGEETANASLSFWGRLPLATDVQDGARWERWKQIQLPIRLKYEDRLSELLRAKNRQYEQIEKDQEAIAVWISTMSPSFALSNVICDIAGTGRLSANKFLKDVRNFEHVVAQQVYSSGFVQRTLVDGEVSVLKQSSTERIKEIPRFSHNPPSLEETIAENLSSIIVLWMWLVVSILAAYLWFYHYDLR